MTKAKTGARVVFGLLWIIFGANFFLHFIPQPPPPEAGLNFMMGLMANPVFFPFMKTIEIVAGVMLLFNIAAPLALLLVAPITVNIVLFHAVLAPQGMPVALLMLVLNVFLGFAYFNSFKPLFKKG